MIDGESLNIHIFINVCCLLNSTIPELGSHESSHELPDGTWMRFDFGDSHPVSCLTTLVFFIRIYNCIIYMPDYFLCSANSVQFYPFETIQDLPILYLQGGSIIPVGPPLQHLGEASPTDELSLFIALDISGKIYCYYVNNAT